MRLATLRVAGGHRLHLCTPEGYVDLGSATGDERLAGLHGFLEAGPAALEAATALRNGAVTRHGDLAPAVPEPGKIFCMGRNYAEHAEEMNKELSAWPEVFLRLSSCLAGPFDEVALPSFSPRCDYEGELGVVVGRGGRHVPADRALEAVAGYVVLNDVTVRDWQHRGQQWTPGKNFEGTLPVGPHVVTADEVPDPTDLAVETRVNGEVVQTGRTSQMIFGIREQIEFLSAFVRLEPGDLIATGTPAGVGVARDSFLQDGDVVEVTVEGVGTIRNVMRKDGGVPASDRWSEIAAQAVSR